MSMPRKTWESTKAKEESKGRPKGKAKDDSKEMPHGQARVQRIT